MILNIIRMFLQCEYVMPMIYVIMMACIPLTFIINEEMVPYQTITINGETHLIKDFRYDHPLIEETVTTSLLAVINSFGTFVIIAVTWFGAYAELYKWKSAVHTLVAYGLAYMIQDFIVAFGKDYIGAFRPNFYDGCGWDNDLGICTVNFEKGRRSFPSGHSSSAAVVFVYLILSLNDIRTVLRAQNNVPIIIDKLLFLVTLLSAFVFLFVGASRIHDFWHHPPDVIAGFLIGGLSACACRYTL